MLKKFKYIRHSQLGKHKDRFSHDNNTNDIRLFNDLTTLNFWKGDFILGNLIISEFIYNLIILEKFEQLPRIIISRISRMLNYFNSERETYPIQSSILIDLLSDLLKQAYLLTPNQKELKEYELKTEDFSFLEIDETSIPIVQRLQIDIKNQSIKTASNKSGVCGLMFYMLMKNSFISSDLSLNDIKYYAKHLTGYKGIDNYILDNKKKNIDDYLKRDAGKGSSKNLNQKNIMVFTDALFRMIGELDSAKNMSNEKEWKSFLNSRCKKLLSHKIE